VVVDFFSMKNSNTQYAAAFIMGFLGLHGVEFVIDRFNKK